MTIETFFTELVPMMAGVTGIVAGIIWAVSFIAQVYGSARRVDGILRHLELKVGQGVVLEKRKAKKE